MNKPNLLYITPVVPNRTGSGASMRAYSVLKALSSHYTVFLLIISTLFRNRPPGRDVSEMCERVAYFPLGPGRDFRLTARLLAYKIDPFLYMRRSSHPMEWMYITHRRLRSVARIFRGIPFDVVHVFRLYMAPYARLFTKENFSGVSQLDLDDIESLTRERLSELFALNGSAAMASSIASEAEKYAEIERSLLPGFDRVFVCSAPDRDRLRKKYPGVRIEVIPNVIHIPKVRTEETTGALFTFLFVGSLGYYPNSEGIIRFCEKVVPLLRGKVRAGFVVTVVGDGISRKDAGRLSLIKEVKLVGGVQDVAPFYRNAHCVVIPIRAGGGTRIKALEAFAYKKPVVSTTTGVEGIDVQHEKHALIADTEELLTEHCFRMMTDPALRKRLADTAFHLVTEFHDTELLKEHDTIFLRN